MFERAFSGEHRIITASSGQEALDILKQEPDVALVFADNYMPGLSGIDVLARIRRDYPDAIRVLLTGNTDMETIIDSINRGHVYQYIVKPWTVSALRVTIKNSLELHVLCKEKNKMLAELEQAPNDLEQEVEERTAELRKANELLMAEIAERKKVGKSLQRVHAERTLVRKEAISLVKAKDLLQEEIARRKGMECTLRESEEWFRKIFESCPLGMLFLDFDYHMVVCNAMLCGLLGYPREEIAALALSDITCVEDVNSDALLRRKLLAGELSDYSIEKRFFKKDGSIVWGILTVTMIYDSQKSPICLLGMIQDITDSKEKEALLMKHKAELEENSKIIEETNTALRILRQKCDREKIKIQEELVNAIKNNLISNLGEFKQDNLDYNEKKLEQVIESSLRSIPSPLRTGYNPILMLLTPGEMQVADLIRKGKTTKEIAASLNLSPKTIETHRRNIRKKSGITNKKINLRTILSS